MSKIATRAPAGVEGETVEDRLARLLDEPSLARVVPHLPPETLHQLIRHRGLDASVSLVAAATPSQLTALLDLDLWRPSRAGHDEVFDVARFGEWLEALVDAGESVAAGTIAALDTDVVVAGLSRYVRVFDPGIFEPTAQSDDERIDRWEAMREGDVDERHLAAPLDERRECEVGGFLIRARRPEAWDAIVAALIALDSEHPETFVAIMRGCRRLSNSRGEIDGLDDLLAAPEQHLHEVAVAREQRQTETGYASPADARAFLQMARESKATSMTPGGGANPIVAAYFRAAADSLESMSERAASPTHVQEHASADTSAVFELLAEAGMLPSQPRALLSAGEHAGDSARLAQLQRLMRHLQDEDTTAFLARGRELAFLANTLLAGCTVQLRRFTPVEASDAAAAVCNLGLECAGEHSPESFLTDHDLAGVFETGWSALHRDVGMFVAGQLMSLLDEIDSVDLDIRAGLAGLRHALGKHHAAGTPWLARGHAEILAMLDVTAALGIAGLLSECPVIAAAMRATLEGRITRVSATDFDFISTRAQIDDVRAFVRKLPLLF